MRKKISLVFIFLVIFQIQIRAETFSSASLISKITIYWDSSLSMKDKDIDKELLVLNNYFKNTPNVEVDLITFSNTINLQKRFDVVNSNWESLKDELVKINYDGVAFYDVLLEKTTSDVVFLFTDGIEVIDKLVLNITNQTHIINSSKKANRLILEQESLRAKGNFIDLSRINIDEALGLLNLNVSQKEIPKSEVVDQRGTLNDEVITGSVYSSNGALLGVSITINGEKGVVTDSSGEFKIEAKKGDILTVSYLGLQTQEILIGEDKRFEIVLVNDETELEEVVVAGKSKPIEEVETGYGKTNKEKLGYAVQSIDSDDLPEGRNDNISVHGKFSGVTRYGGNDDISQMILRANSMLLNVYPLILVDGTPISRSSSTGRVQLSNFIDPNNIAKITVLKGLVATNRYGSEGGNGVILITTKTSLAGVKSENSKNSALVKNNDFTEDLAFVNNSLKEFKYIKEFKKYKTLDEVYTYYLSQRIDYLDNPMYFVHISDYFLQFSNRELSSKILLNCLEVNQDNIELLKLVAYKAEQQQDLFLAKIIYEKLAKLKPVAAQSYRDLALIYQEIGYYQEALDIYKKIKNNSYQGINFSGIEKVVTNEMRRLISKHQTLLDLSDVSDYYLKDINYDARIVIDYNDISADFEIQFVNPHKKFFSWPHTKAENEIRLYEEKEMGFNTEEFLLIDAQKGEWQINIESKVKKSKNPVVLKYTVYKNYGKSNETIEVNIIMLNNMKEKKLLGKIKI